MTTKQIIKQAETTLNGHRLRTARNRITQEKVGLISEKELVKNLSGLLLDHMGE
jgi:hypothetical protein